MATTTAEQEAEAEGEEEEEEKAETPPGSETLLPVEPTFKSQFEAFALFKDLLADGTTMTLSKSDTWMIQAELLDMKAITTTDTGICWIKYKKRCLDFEEYKQFLQDLAERKGMQFDVIIQRLIDSGNPGEKSKKQKKELEEKRKADELF